MATYPPPSNRGSPVYNPVNYNIPNTGGNATAGSGAATLAGNNVFTGSNSFVGITSSGNNSISGYASLNGSNIYTINADNLFQTGSSSGNLPITLQQDTSLASTKIGQDKMSNNFDIVNSVSGSGIYFSDSSHNFTLTANSSGQAVFSGGVSGVVSLSADNTLTGTNTFTKQIIPELGINVLTTDKTATYTEIYSNADAISGGTAIFTQGKLNINNKASIDSSGNLNTTGTLKPQTITDNASSVGSSGQVLSSTATGLAWVTQSGGGGGGNVSTTTSNTYDVGTTQTYQTTSTNFGATIKFQNNTYSTTTQVLTDSANSGNFLIVNNTAGSGINFGDGVGTFTLKTNSSNQIVSANGLNISGTSSIAGYAPLASPALTGNPTAPTQVNTDNSTKIATTAFCNSLITAQNAKYTFVSDAVGTSSWNWTNPAGIPATAYSFYWTITDRNPVNGFTYTNANTTLTLQSNASNGFCASGYAYRVAYASLNPTISAVAYVPTNAVSYQGLPTAPSFYVKEGIASGTKYLPVYTCVLPVGTAVVNPISLYLTLTAIV